jgi:hypothetical protein
MSKNIYAEMKVRENREKDFFSLPLKRYGEPGRTKHVIFCGRYNMATL